MDYCSRDKFHRLAIALQFLKMGNKELVQAEKNRFIELANKLELGMKFDKFDELVGTVRFKINETHEGNDFFIDTSSKCIDKLIQAGDFNSLEIVDIIWMLLNLAYADGNFSNDENSVIDEIGKQFEIKESVIEELKDCAKTLVCLEAKSEWLETTKKPYKEIKTLKDEIEKDEALVAKMVANIINNSNVA